MTSENIILVNVMIYNLVVFNDSISKCQLKYSVNFVFIASQTGII